MDSVQSLPRNQAQRNIVKLTLRHNMFLHKVGEREVLGKIILDVGYSSKCGEGRKRNGEREG
jgi:hypothetical protein